MRWTFKSLIAVAAAGFLAGSAAAAQPESASAQRSSSHSNTDEYIVVEGRLLSTNDLPVQAGTKTPEGTAQTSRSVAADARMFAKCALRTDIALIHAAIDGTPYRSPSADALHRIIQSHGGCYPNLPAIARAPELGECNPAVVNPRMAVCRAFYDRAALIEAVLAAYAPGLKLTRAQLSDPAVLARFHAREADRAKARLATDRLYFSVAACLVQAQPERAIRLLNTKPGSRTEERHRSAMIGLAPVCVGNAEKVQVDPSQFRLYVTDAVYSWAVAVRGTDTLLPAG